jgi:hypothetical protein
MALMLTRNKQVAITLEGTSGTYAAPVSGSYGLMCTDITAEATPETLDNNAYRATISAQAARIGKTPAAVTLAGELKNSGTANMAPKVGSLLQLCGMAERAVRTFTTSAMSNAGQLVLGSSLVVGGTSSARGLVLAFTGTTSITLAVLSGTFASGEAITCPTVPSFTGTLSSAGVAAGFAYTPVSDPATMKTGSIYVYDGGLGKPCFGAVGNISFELSADGYPTFSSSIVAIADKANWGASANEASGITYETALPSVVSAAHLKVDSYTAAVVSSVTADLGNSTTILKDLNSGTWYRHGVVTGRAAQASVQLLALAPAEYPVYTRLFAGSTAHISWVIGSGAGTGIRIFASKAQFTGVSTGDTDGYVSQTLSLKLTGDDDELILWFE